MINQCNNILFVLGNGPSLSKIMNDDKYLNYIKQHDTFCLNNFYKMMKKYEFTPTYYGCFDYVVNQNKKEDYSKLVLEETGIKEFYFIGSRKDRQSLYPKEVIDNDRFIKFNFVTKGLGGFPKISEGFDHFVDAGASGANALQIGIMKGYKKIILLGCDCNYVEKVDGSSTNAKGNLVINGTLDKNPNYWFPEYHSNGDTYNLPQTQKFQIGGWKNIFNNCPEDVEILNCSEISQIPFFDKIHIDKLMSKLNVLIISTYNQSTYYVHAYETWKNSLNKYCNVCYYGEGYPNFIGWDATYDDVYKQLNFIPDIELWCGGKGNTKPQYIDDKKILKNIAKYKRIPKLILICDYWEIIRDSTIEIYKKRENILKSYGVVGYFSFYSQVEAWMKNVIKSTFNTYITFPYVYDNLFTTFRNVDYVYDINLQWCYKGYPFRTLVHEKLIHNKKYKIFNAKFTQYQDCNGDKDILYNYFKHKNPVANFANLLNVSRITIADGYTKYITNVHKKYKLDGTDLFNARYPQVLSSKSVLFSPLIESSHIEPLYDGIHYVCIDENNFQQKIDYYLNNPQLLDNIIINANKWALENCSVNKVGLRLSNELNKTLLSNELNKTLLSNELNKTFNENITYNGQILQDKFVLNLLKFKKNGTFVEIGTNDPIVNNNTYLFEKNFNWKGIMIEYDDKFEQMYKQKRTSKYIIKNAEQIDFLQLLQTNNMPYNIDYLQIDLEVNNGSTINVLYHFDKYIFDIYKFAVITFEHDMYRENGKYNNTREVSRKIFEKRGYKLIFGDVNQSHDIVFEDWYIHPNLIDEKFYTKIIELNKKNYTTKINRILESNSPWRWSNKNKTYTVSTINYKDIIYE